MTSMESLSIGGGLPADVRRKIADAIGDDVGGIDTYKSVHSNANNVGLGSSLLSNQIEFGSSHPSQSDCVHCGSLGLFNLKTFKVIDSIHILDKDVLSDLLRLVFSYGCTDLLLQDSEPVTVKKDGQIVRISDSHFTGDMIIKAVEDQAAVATIKGDLGEHGAANLGLRVMSADGKIINFRLNVTRTEAANGGDGGVQMSFRMRGLEIPSFSDLKVDSPIANGLLVEKGAAIVLGEPGHGKSTLVAAAIKEVVKNQADNIVTYELPIEQSFRTIHPSDRKGMISQTDVGVSFHGDWSSAAANFLRRSTSSALLGEITDYASAKAFLKMSNSGGRIWTTGHSSTPHEFFVRYKSLFPKEEQEEAFIGLMIALKTVVCVHLAAIEAGGRVQLRGLFSITEQIKRTIEPLDIEAKITYLREAYISQGNTIIDDLERKRDMFTEQQYHRLRRLFASHTELFNE